MAAKTTAAPGDWNTGAATRKHALGNVNRAELEQRLDAQRAHVRHVVDEARQAAADAAVARDSFGVQLLELKYQILDLDSIRCNETRDGDRTVGDRIAALERLVESRTLRGRWRRLLAWMTGRDR